MSDEFTPPAIDSVGLPVPQLPEGAKNLAIMDLVELDDPGSKVDALYMSNGDPNFYYQWLNTRPEMLERNKMIYGYEIVGPDDPVKTIILSNPAGERKFGDLVLGRIARKRYDKLAEMQRQRTINALGAPNETWAEEARRVGLIPVDTTKVEKKAGM